MAFNTLNEAVQEYRSAWLKVPREDLRMRLSLSVQHGIVERIKEAQWNQEVSKYCEKGLFNSRFAYYRNPRTIVAMARAAQGLGLDIATPTDFQRISSVSGTFGVIQRVKNEKADISFYVRESTGDPSSPVIEGIEVGLCVLPAAYRNPGLWVCWVEYEFKDSRAPVGNFEPASTR